MSRPTTLPRNLVTCFFAGLLTLCLCANSWAEQAQGDRDVSLNWDTDSTGPRRFISVHGRRSAIFGYDSTSSDRGLEIWAYPVQILSSYKVIFHPQGSTTAIDGHSILRRIIYSPESVTRIYAGPDFVVRERLFVPLDEPGALANYEIEGADRVDVEVRFTPSLNLMWPAGLGGQEIAWNPSASAYMLSEGSHQFTASIGSSDIVSHDDTPNTGWDVAREPGIGFTMRAAKDRNKVEVIIAEGGQQADTADLARKLLEQKPSLEKAAADHYSDLLNHVLQIETPDDDTNRALAWAEIALDQAWVCNPDLGCGLVAGYGPSRPARRPQYDWFFAGDGMVGIPALLAEGQWDRARQELEFILKYQDPQTGMIWHELSQSAGQIDWNKYPYMWVHIELTFNFLKTVETYVSVTGDFEFAKSHWAAIEHAYQYCRTLLDAKDSLPHIPLGKRGQREQEQLSDELTLSTAWAEAAQAFADLAAQTGHSLLVDEAHASSQKAIDSIRKQYWDEQNHFWISGHTESGAPVMDREVFPVRVLGKPLASPEEHAALLDQLASSDYQTDWGTRGRASNASSYDPNSYANGSVWGIGTADMASEFWTEHRPATALPIWRALVPWNWLDSLGHIHETLAGDYYHEEVESVPEQTWSSASFLGSAVHGLFGLDVDSALRRIIFSPHLPADWKSTAIRNIRIADSLVNLRMSQSLNELRLDIQNEGPTVQMIFDPEIPLGAKIQKAQLNGRPISAQLKDHPEDSHAKLEFNLPQGSTSLTIHYRGGVALVLLPPDLKLGETSNAIKITGAYLHGSTYIVNFDYVSSSPSTFELQTPWRIQETQGASAETIAPDLYRFAVKPPTKNSNSDSYRPGQVSIRFDRN